MGLYLVVFEKFFGFCKYVNFMDDCGREFKLGLKGFYFFFFNEKGVYFF